MAVMKPDWIESLAAGRPVVTETIASDDRLDTKRLATIVRFDNYVRDAGYREATMRKAKARLEGEIATQLPACKGCNRVEISVEVSRNVTTGDDEARLEAGCREAKFGMACQKRNTATIEPCELSEVPWTAMSPIESRTPTKVRTPDQPATSVDAW